MTENATEKSPLPLTDRETQVAREIIAGKSHKEVGAALGIASGTVKIHLKNVARKLGLTAATRELKARAKEFGL